MYECVFRRSIRQLGPTIANDYFTTDLFPLENEKAELTAELVEYLIDRRMLLEETAPMSSRHPFHIPLSNPMLGHLLLLLIKTMQSNRILDISLLCAFHPQVQCKMMRLILRDGTILSLINRAALVALYIYLSTYIVMIGSRPALHIRYLQCK